MKIKKINERLSIKLPIHVTNRTLRNVVLCCVWYLLSGPQLTVFHSNLHS